MNSKKRLERIEQAQSESERLNSQVRMDGVGEDPAVRDLLSDNFIEANDAEALNIALALQQLIRGQNSILGMVTGQGEAITKLTERMNKFDADAERWQKDRQSFFEEVQERADALKITDPEQKARLIAKAGKQVQNEIQKALAAKAVGDMELNAWMEAQPKVTVTSPGILVTVNRNGTLVSEVEPEIIRIRNREWILSPNIPTDVPKPVADEFFSRQKTRLETSERKQILDANKPMDNVIMAQKWSEIGKRYNAPTDMMRSDDRS